ncbi:MAG: alanine--glyoxylate aminotransferase family protein [Pseudomonadales bacterium]|nr:alanine--glyoxylate aminotransferase family protein [Pseudomonadales bacterium]MCP5345149.1 alanine--glyoxylate aminotransferase family protein [Pseudomonadales bacterium]
MNASFHPPARTLMGPGPSDVNPRILEALSRPTIGHLDPAFIQLMDEIKALLQYAFQTQNALTLPVSAPGSAGMEAVFVNLLERGDKAIVCVNGAFGGRMKENVERCGATAVIVAQEWGKAIDLNAVEDALKAHPDACMLAFVHAETSTGVRSDAQALAALAHRYDCLAVVDAVTSLGGIALEVDAWGIDAIYSGTQKCLSCIPGLSPVSFSERAVARIRGRQQRVQSWFLDMNLIMDYWGGSSRRSYHHTAPINPLYALHEALLCLREEGLENAWQRHANHHNALAAGLHAMGLPLIVDAGHRLPQLNAVGVPDGIDEAAVRAALLQQYDLEIGAGLGTLAGKIWRIGLMGYACNRRNVLQCLSALEAVLIQQGMALPQGAAVAAANARYQQG